MSLLAVLSSTSVYSSDTSSGENKERDGVKAPTAQLEQVLSHRELQVVLLVAAGLSNKETGEKLGLSEFSIKSHLARIFGRLGFGKREILAAHAAAQGLIDNPEGRARLKSLTERELEVASPVQFGATNAQIAKKLNLSEDTIKTHLKTAFRKLGIHSREQLAVIVAAAERHKREAARARK